MSLEIQLNGKPASFEGNLTISGLLEIRGVKTPMVAVELNGSIVPREQFGTASINQGDAVEVVTFVGGGAG